MLLATGSVPRLIPGFERGGPIMTSDEVLDLDYVPARVAVIGGGAIGCEFASTFADLGAQVTILEFLPKILPGLDADVANVVVRSFKKKKIDIRTGVKVTGHTPNGSGAHHRSSSATGESVEVDACIVSVGRRPYADQLGLGGHGGQGHRSRVRRRRRVLPHRRAGRVRDRRPDRHAAARPRRVRRGDPRRQADPRRETRCRSCTTVCRGRSTAIPRWRGPVPARTPARRPGIDVVVGKHPFKFNSRAQIVGETEGMVKVVARKNPDGTAGQVLGVHMVGPWVTEQLAGGYLAVNWEATVAEVAEFIQPHPSLSELFGETMLSLTGRDFNG